jgi:hypothetical protein
MAKTKKRASKPKMTFPLAVIAGFVPGASLVAGKFKAGGLEYGAAEASRVFLGYASTNKFGYNDPIGFHPYLLKYGMYPILAGFLIHKLANKLGINGAIARAGIPFVRV